MARASVREQGGISPSVEPVWAKIFACRWPNARVRDYSRARARRFAAPKKIRSKTSFTGAGRGQEAICSGLLPAMKSNAEALRD